LRISGIAGDENGKNIAQMLPKAAHHDKRKTREGD
jgi:hypothetical protein